MSMTRDYKNEIFESQSGLNGVFSSRLPMQSKPVIRTTLEGVNNNSIHMVNNSQRAGLVLTVHPQHEVSLFSRQISSRYYCVTTRF